MKMVGFRSLVFLCEPVVVLPTLLAAVVLVLIDHPVIIVATATAFAALQRFRSSIPPLQPSWIRVDANMFSITLR